MISKIAPQKFFQKNIQMLEAWKPTEDMKFRLEFVFMCPFTYIGTWYKNCFRNLIGSSSNVKQWGQNFFKKARGYKIEFYNFLSFTLLELLTLESRYFIGRNSSMYDIKKNNI